MYSIAVHRDYWAITNQKGKIIAIFFDDDNKPGGINAERFLLTLRKESLFRRKREIIKKKNSRKSK